MHNKLYLIFTLVNVLKPQKKEERMTRIKRSYVAKRRRNNILALTKTFKRAHSKLTRSAKQQVMKKLTYSHRDRNRRKRDFRHLWITRINAAARVQQMCYSQMTHLVRKAKIMLNRKMVAQIAMLDSNSFNSIITLVE